MARSEITSKMSSRGFTLIEILVVVVVITLLIAILLPSMGKFQDQARKASTLSQMNALKMGLQVYYDKHKMYPSSSSANQAGTLAYTGLAAQRGQAMLAEGLVGYMSGTLDGEDGPGFRETRANAAMGKGELFGPYVDSGKNYKRITPGLDEVFIDSWENEILYYRASGAPAQFIFSTPGQMNGYFVSTDCGNTGGGKYPLDDLNVNPPTPASLERRAFFVKHFNCLPLVLNVVNGNVAGKDSYLLISAGPDSKYFTEDDLIMTKE